METVTVGAGLVPPMPVPRVAARNQLHCMCVLHELGAVHAIALPMSVTQVSRDPVDTICAGPGRKSRDGNPMSSIRVSVIFGVTALLSAASAAAQQQLIPPVRSFELPEASPRVYG